MACCLEGSTAQEVGKVLDALPFGRVHAAIFVSAVFSYMSIGGLGDPIGLAFPGLEAEWGPQPESRLALAASMASAGQLAAAVLSGPLCDRFGRCPVARCGTVLGLSAILLGTLAPNLWVLSVARLLGGFGFGACLVAVPTLLSECVPRRAARALVMYQAGWPFAAFIFAVVLERLTWRAAVFTGVLPGVGLMVIFFVPGCIVESPQSLVARGREREAWESLARLGASPRDLRMEVEVTDMATQEEKGQRGAVVVGMSPDGMNSFDAGCRENCNVEGTESKGSVDLESSPSKLDRPIGQSAGTPVLYVVVLAGFVCHGLASQMLKVWLPDILVRLGTLDPGHGGAFAAMWGFESLGILGMGILFGGESGSGKDGEAKAVLVHQLTVSRAAFLVSGMAAVANLGNHWPLAVGVLGALHLLCQAAAYNFLMAYAACCFPPKTRARQISGLVVGNFAGVLVGPHLGSWVLQWAPQMMGPIIAISICTGTYFLGSALVTYEICRHRRKK